MEGEDGGEILCDGTTGRIVLPRSKRTNKKVLLKWKIEMKERVIFIRFLNST